MQKKKNLEHYYIVLRRKIIRPILKNRKLAYFLSKNCLKTFLAMMYESWTGIRMNFRNPRDMNQSMIRLSYENSRNPKTRELIPQCVDKYAVREYIESHGYGDTLNECYGVYDNADDINFDALPNQFVMKMTNASGRNWICSDKSKANWEHMKDQFNEWLQDHDFGWQTGEWQYALIQPRILIEKYLSTLGESAPIDYKFQCFHGEPKSCFVAYDRNPLNPHGDVNFDDYDIDWNRTDNILSHWHRNRRLLPKPQSWEQMIKMARDLSKDFPYVRFDVYEIDGKILFGEMTFTPQGCVQEFYTDEYLKKMKDLI